jgi:hypothetical protein
MKNPFKKLFGKKYPQGADEPLCVYAGPEMMGRRRPDSSEMNDVYMGPPDEIDEPRKPLPSKKNRVISAELLEDLDLLEDLGFLVDEDPNTKTANSEPANDDIEPPPIAPVYAGPEKMEDR